MMPFNMRVSVLLFFSMICMVHSTVFHGGSKNNIYDFKDSISLSRSLDKSDTRIVPNNQNFQQTRTKYKNDNQKSIKQLSEKLKGESKNKSILRKGNSTRGSGCSQKMGECSSKKEPCSGDLFPGKKFCKNTNFVCCVQSGGVKITTCEAVGGSCKNMKKGCNMDEETSTDTCKNPKRFKCCIKKIIGEQPPNCEYLRGSCIKMIRSCKGEEKIGAEYCDNPKRFKCCIKEDLTTEPSVNCETLDGSCIKKKKICKGEEKIGAEYCQYPKRFKCCISGCQIKSACSSSNGVCIKQNEICDGEEFTGKKYCTSFKTCKCCVKFSTTESFLLTSFSPTTFISDSEVPLSTKGLIITTAKTQTTKPIFSTIKTTEARPILTTISIKDEIITTTFPKGNPTISIKPIPTPEDKSCYREMDLDNKVHTMLLPTKNDCKAYRRGVTEDSKTNILKLHNQYRTQISLGQELRGAPGPQPPGSNIREIVWNEELAKVAQAWANQCPLGADCYQCRALCSRDYTVGQSPYFLVTSKDEESWTKAITTWYEEVVDFNATKVEKLTRPGPGEIITQYSQMMWADTYEIGCGAIYYPLEIPLKNGETAILNATRLYICNYGPTGNYLNRAVYKIGEAATDCPNGVSSTYPALCA